MTTRQYLAALKTLDLPPYGEATKEALGLAKSQLDRLAGGRSAPSPMLERLLAALIKLKAR